MQQWLHFSFPTAILIAVTVASISAETRIIGGERVDQAKYPYLVSIRYRETEESPYRHKCAGVIYSDYVVLTCAQCIVNIGANERVVIVAAANTRTGGDGMPYPVDNYVAHPSYSSWTIDYDIGMMILKIPFQFKSNQLKPISIYANRPASGKMGTIAGWGYQEEWGPSSNYLEEAKVPIVSEADCEKAYGKGEITQRMICAGFLNTGGIDGCQGDTGGPLVLDGQLAGLISWGRGCARPGFPSVYTFVSPHVKWINDTIATNVKNN